MKETYQEREARELREIEAFNAALAKVVRELPVALNVAFQPGWSAQLLKSDYRHVGDWAVFTHTDGRSFDVRSVYANPTRFSVSGNYPRGKHGIMHFPYNPATPGYQFPRPSITVAIDRPVKALAAAIGTRFLPDYNAIYQAMVEQNTANDNYQAKKDAMTAEFAKMVGKEIKTDKDCERAQHDVSFEVKGHYHSFKTNGTTVDLTLESLSPELAKKVIALVQG